VRLIDADALKYAKLNDTLYIVFKEDIDKAPTIDPVTLKPIEEDNKNN